MCLLSKICHRTKCPRLENSILTYSTWESISYYLCFLFWSETEKREESTSCQSKLIHCIFLSKCMAFVFFLDLTVYSFWPFMYSNVYKIVFEYQKISSCDVTTKIQEWRGVCCKCNHLWRQNYKIMKHLKRQRNRTPKVTEVKRWLYNGPSCICLSAVLAATTFHRSATYQQQREYTHFISEYLTKYFSGKHNIQKWCKHLSCLEIFSSICHLFIVEACSNV